MKSNTLITYLYEGHLKSSKYYTVIFFIKYKLVLKNFCHKLSQEKFSYITHNMMYMYDKRYNEIMCFTETIDS